MRNLSIASRSMHASCRLDAIDLTNFQFQPRKNPTITEFISFERTPLDVRTKSHDEFAKFGVLEYLDNLEIQLKPTNDENQRTKSVDLDKLCRIFYRLSSWNKLCENQIVETCGLERIANLLKMIVERQEKINESQSLELLCHGTSKLNRALKDKQTKDQLAVLLKPVVSPLLSRIFGREDRIAFDGRLARGINRLARAVADDGFSAEEKAKIARFVWKEFEVGFANSRGRKPYFVLLDVSILLVKLDINEEKGSFEWVDRFIEYWSKCTKYDWSKPCPTKLFWHLNFLLIGLKNQKYDAVLGQKSQWSEALRQTKSLLTDSNVVEDVMKYVDRMPSDDKTCQQLAGELKLLFK